MTRPNRYPYTRSQWVEETYNFYSFDGGVYLTQHILENRLTGEIKDKEVER